MMQQKPFAVLAATLGIAMALQVPALAQAPNLGPGWELAETRKVKVWIPFPDKPGNGKWELVDFNTYRMFQERLANPAPAMPAVPAPDVLFGPIKKGAAYEESGPIEPVRRGNLIHRFQTKWTVTPQSRTETTIHKGWKLSEFTRIETRSQFLKTKYGLHDLSYQVPVTNFAWNLVELRRDSQEASLDPLRAARVIEHMPPQQAGVTELAAAGKRAGIFSGDSGSGKAAPALEAAKVRSAMGANQAKASDVKANDEVLVTVADLKETFAQAMKQIQQMADADLKPIKEAIDQLPTAEAKAMSERREATEKAMKQLAESLEAEAQLLYAAAKRNAQQVGPYRTLVEDGPIRLDAAYDQKIQELRQALEAVLLALGKPAPAQPAQTLVVKTPPLEIKPVERLEEVVSIEQKLDAIDLAAGTYVSRLGSAVTLTRIGRSNNVKVDATMGGSYAGYVGSLPSVAFDKPWTVVVKKGKYSHTFTFKLDAKGQLQHYLNGSNTGFGVKQ